ALLFTILCEPLVLTTEGAPLNLRVLVRTNDPAPGVPNGRFHQVPPSFGNDLQFGPPAAAGNHFAFQAAAAVRDSEGNLIEGGGPGLWVGAGNSLAKIVIRRQGTPPLGTNTHVALMNVSESGKVAFY